MKSNYLITSILLGTMLLQWGCSKKDSNTGGPSGNPSALVLVSAKIGNTGLSATGTTYGVAVNQPIRLKFNNAVDRASVAGAITLKEKSVTPVTLNFSYENSDSTVVVSGASNLKYITAYLLGLTRSVKSAQGGYLYADQSLRFISNIDSSDKFPLLTDNALLDLVQRQTFKYFWDFAHPVSGLARERNSSGETVTSGGSGFGIMAIPVAVSRGFITRAQAVTRMQTIVGFLKNTAQKFHGAFPHWLNGTTGAVIPFSANDDGADLVETSYLIQGLITARQYFDGLDPAETALRNDINSICNGVEWSWFRQGNQQVLYWHWSPNSGWSMNMAIRGWNECLITYVLAASSTTNPIPRTVYDQGWAQNGALANNNSYYGYQLPLGSAYGGPLFFAHYSFLGIDPRQLNDPYANYQTQNTNHSLINFKHCVNNPNSQFGYSNLCWGLTASDIPNGYSASSPTNDLGVIAPTAALSSFPYTPTESMNALKFFYYKLGDKLWGEYGFADAFSLKETWFAESTLAIDQGPIIVMIENYRTGLLWNLFTSAPEVKDGMRNLGFTAPYL
ncbi:MAG: glucoamylase family protein [Ferruginibacter sp.]